MDSTRKKEDEIKKATAEQLELFRRQREEAEKPGNAEERQQDSEQWMTAPKKRKRKAEKEALKGGKLRRKSSTADEKEKAQTPEETRKLLAGDDTGSTTIPNAMQKTPTSKAPPQALPPDGPKTVPASTASTTARPAASLGLDVYSSDDG